MEVIGPVPEQKCKFCRRRRCTDPECSEEFMIKRNWSKNEVDIKFWKFIHSEVIVFSRLIEHRNKFGKLRYMGTVERNYLRNVIGVKEFDKNPFYDHDQLDFESLFTNYDIDKLYLKIRSCRNKED